MSPNSPPQHFSPGPRLVFLGCVALFLILGTAYFFYSLQPSLRSEAPVAFKIARGESFRSLGARLSQEGLVRSLSVFKFYTLLTGRAQRFQPGVYTLSSTMSVPAIVDALTAGGRNEVTVVVPEGSTLKDVDTLLARAGVLPAGTFLHYRVNGLAIKYPFLQEARSLEGFLFPDTYRFELDSDAESVLARFFDTFQQKAWEPLQGSRDWYERLTLASFLEREVPGFEDRRLVAGILLKRMRLKMPLQVDATLSYAKCGGGYLECPEVRIARSDLALDSPYNTYQRLGLTPTPIANPGVEAIKAALAPKESGYLFYLTRSDTKETLFSVTLDEHNRKRAKYL